MASSRRCIVLVPYLTHVEAGCEEGLRELERRGFVVRRFPSTAAIDRMRCELATAALAEGFDELMWIDSDIAFDPESVQRLRDHDLPIVGGIYAKKGVQDLAVYLEPETTQLTMGAGGALVDVRYLGTGFLCTQRVVYDDIQRVFSLPPCNTRFGRPSVPYFLPMVISDPPGYWYLGEDYAFCERARQAGHKIVVDSTIRLGHIGAYTYGWEDAGQAMPRVASATFNFTRSQPAPASPAPSSPEPPAK